MARADRPAEEAIDELLAVSRLLEERRLARVYTHILIAGEQTVEDIVDELEIAQSTVYQDVALLADLGLLRTQEGTPTGYVARPVHVTFRTDDGPYAVTPTLVAAFAHSYGNEDLEIFLDRHGIGKLAAALEYAVLYVEGYMSERVAARELDLHPVEGISVLQALRGVIESVRDVDPYFESIGDAVEDIEA